MQIVPRIFTSYSHDDSAHKAWVVRLADRLVRNGVDVILDQWDIRLGGDLPSFMEAGLTGVDRVLAVCSSSYVQKANKSQGGVGYEKMILTGQLMRNVNSNKIIPLVRNNFSDDLLPTFLSSRLYVDFRNDELFETHYAELLREIHGRQMVARPSLGPNPFTQNPPIIDPLVSFAAERYVSSAQAGTVTFDYSNNNGRYVVGSADMQFETCWTGSGANSIYAYNDPPSIRSIALASGSSKIAQITDATKYDTSSRYRSPQTGEVLLWQNTAGYFMATKIENIQARSHGASVDELTFTYVIAADRGIDFEKVVPQ